MDKQLQDMTNEELIAHIAELRQVISKQHQALSKIVIEADEGVNNAIDGSEFETRFYIALGSLSIVRVIATSTIKAVA